MQSKRQERRGYNTVFTLQTCFRIKEIEKRAVLLIWHPLVEEFQATFKQFGVPKLYINTFTMRASAVAQGMLAVENAALEASLGRKPTTTAQFITQVYE